MIRSFGSFRPRRRTFRELVVGGIEMLDLKVLLSSMANMPITKAAGNYSFEQVTDPNTGNMEHRLFYRNRQIGALLQTPEGTVSFRGRPDFFEPNGFGSTHQFNAFLNDADATGGQLDFVDVSEAGFQFTASGDVATAGGSAGTWSFSGTIAFFANAQEIQLQGTLVVNLSASLDKDLNLGGIPSNYVHQIPLNTGQIGNSGDMREFRITRGSDSMAPDNVWVPAPDGNDIAGFFPQDPSAMVTTTVVGNQNLSDPNRIAITKPTVSLTITAQTGQMIAGAIWDSTMNSFEFDNFRASHLVRPADTSATSLSYDIASTWSVPQETFFPKGELVAIDRLDGASVQGIKQTYPLTFQPGADWFGLQASQFLTGDVNGDGTDDVVAVTPGGDVFVSQGGTSTPLLWGQWTAGAASTDLNIGDFNNDGRDDLIARGGDGRWRILRSNGFTFAEISGPSWAKEGWADGEAQIGDFNGDGLDDVALRRTTGQWYFALGTSAGLQTQYAGAWNETIYAWSLIRTGDFNGNGRTDIMGRTQFGGWFTLEIPSNANRFALRFSGRWSPGYTWNDVTVADFTGDGVDDLGGWEQRGIWWILEGTTGVMPLHAFGRWDPARSWQATAVDLNGDVEVDIVGYAAGEWWSLVSNGDRFEPTLFLGETKQLSANVEILGGDFVPS
ncbi:MAG: VCBS repeat-containing protein [Planctomycetaceae bacterium]|nr:VCBS repeat-containing protein [Planctomycetaceae bacterium]